MPNKKECPCGCHWENEKPKKKCKQCSLEHIKEIPQFKGTIETLNNLFK